MIIYGTALLALCHLIGLFLGELLGIDTVGDDYLATLKFTGLIKEAPAASAEPFAELWNLSKPQSGNGGWVLAGIQQVA